MVAPKKNAAEVAAKAIYKVVRPLALKRMKQAKPLPRVPEQGN